MRLKKVLDEATGLLTRNSADVGAKVQKAEQDISALQGRIDEMAHAQEVQARQSADEHNRFETRIGTLEQTSSKIVDKVAPTMPDDKDQLWTRRPAALGRPARRRTPLLPRVHPALPAGPACAAGLPGDRHVVRPGDQVPERRRGVPEGARHLPSRPRSRRRCGSSRARSSSSPFCTDAKSLLTDLMKRFPKSPRSADAKDEIKRIGKLPKSACSS